MPWRSWHCCTGAFWRDAVQVQESVNLFDWWAGRQATPRHAATPLTGHWTTRGIERCACVFGVKSLSASSHGSWGVETEAVGHCVVTFSGWQLLKDGALECLFNPTSFYWLCGERVTPLRSSSDEVLDAGRRVSQRRFSPEGSAVCWGLDWDLP